MDLKQGLFSDYITKKNHATNTNSETMYRE